MSEGHARLGPSNHRWPVCPGSVREEERYPDVAGEAAIDGTGSHLLLEMCLDNNVPAIQYDQQIVGTNHPDNHNGWMVAPDRIERVQMCLNYVTRRVAELKEQFTDCDVKVESEQRSNPGEAFNRKDWWGTVDITITARHQMTCEVYFLEVIDYKDGRMYVSEKNNSQLISYLFGKMHPHIKDEQQQADRKWLFKSELIGGCRMTIVQPKTNPVVRYVCSTRSDDGINPATVVNSACDLAWSADQTDDADAPLVSGKHCQWCKANPKRGGHCTAETNQSLQTVESMSNDIANNSNSLFELVNQVVADPKSLTVNQLSDLADAEAGFMDAFKKVKDEIKLRIDQEIPVPGWKIVQGKGSNVWNAEEKDIAKKLKSRRLKQADIYPTKLISPAAVMKLGQLTDAQKEKIKADMITYVVGKPTLKAVAHDKTVTQSPTDDIQSMFASVEGAQKSDSTITEEVSFF